MNQFEPANLPGLASAAGQPFSEANIANDRDTLLTYYYATDFPRRPSTLPGRSRGLGTSIVVYTITEGRREYVRDVLISGLKTTRRNPVEHNITLKAGDPLSPTEQTDIQK